MISLSSHVLDTTLGRPAGNMKVTLTTPDGSVCECETNDDGRIGHWPDIEFIEGSYQLRFFTEPYLLQHHKQSFYPFVDIHFMMHTHGGHYHVPLLISPHGFSSYRGS